MKQEISREDVKTIIERELKRKEYEKSMNEGVFDVFKSKKRKEALRELESVAAFLNNALLDIFTQPYKYQESPSAPNRGREMKSKIDGRKVKMDRIFSKGAVPGRIKGDDSYMMLQNWVEINRKNKMIQVLEDRLKKLIQDYEDDPRKSYHPLHVTAELRSLSRYAQLLLELDSGAGARPYTRKYEEGIKVTKNQLKNMIEEELALKEGGVYRPTELPHWYGDPRKKNDITPHREAIKAVINTKLINLKKNTFGGTGEEDVRVLMKQGKAGPVELQKYAEQEKALKDELKKELEKLESLPFRYESDREGNYDLRMDYEEWTKAGEAGGYKPAGVAESKKDMLKRMIAEELTKVEKSKKKKLEKELEDLKHK
jgi:hypothetical protein